MSMSAFLRSIAVGLFLTSACSGTGTSPGTGTVPIAPDVWGDGHVLQSSVEIAAGSTITIEPGAQVTVSPDVTITVRGVLKVASAAGPHAKISPQPQGQPWGGIIVASGGTLLADGLDLESPTMALDIQPGSIDARYDHGTITGADVPFRLELGSRLETSHATVLGATSSSDINGDFTASYLDYQKSGFAAGLTTGGAHATLRAADSTFRGTANAGGDYIVSLGAKLIHVEYSTITNSHCAFHFNDVDQFQIDHVTAGASSPTGPGDLNAWGAMLYGSGAGPNTISNSNFVNSSTNLDLLGTNGPLTITNTYSTGKNTQADTGWTWAPADVASAPIANAQPR
jgi:hypothetical protein